MKVDLQNSRSQKIDDFLEDDLLLLLFFKKTEKKKSPSQSFKTYQTYAWVRNIFRKREELGEFSRLVQELRNEDRE